VVLNYYQKNKPKTIQAGVLFDGFGANKITGIVLLRKKGVEIGYAC